MQSHQTMNTDQLLLRCEIDAFNAEYAAALDDGDLNRWPGFFSEAPVYQLISRENEDADLPVGPIYCDSQGMLRDRAVSIQNSMVYSPRSILHQITNTRILQTDGDGTCQSQSNFLLVENMLDRSPKILMAGRYLDTFVREAGSLRLRLRKCVYHTLLIQTSVIFPV